MSYRKRNFTTNSKIHLSTERKITPDDYNLSWNEDVAQQKYFYGVIIFSKSLRLASIADDVSPAISLISIRSCALGLLGVL